MRYEFPYENIQGINIDDNMDVKVYRVKEISSLHGSTQEIVKYSLENPIGLPQLEMLIKATDKVLIIIDDISRPTPISEFIHVIIEKILSVGVIKSNIRFLIALGTHRPMTSEEIEQKLGTEVANQFEIINHEWNNPDALCSYGCLSDGTEIILNKLMRDSNFILGIGSIAPHPAAGFSGGGKIITPGVATDAAAGEFHWQSIMYPQNEVLGIRNNKMRDLIDKIAKKAGLNYIVNVIMDGSNKVVECVSGDPIDAHKKGAEISINIFKVEVENPECADIFIIDTHPLDQELWQGVKALCALECIIPDNAIGIIISPLREGVCKSHPQVLKYGFQPYEIVKDLVLKRIISKVVGHNLVQGGRLLAHTTCFLVSPGVTKKDANKMGFRYFEHAQKAVEEAIRIKGSNSKIIILNMGGEIAPIRSKNSEA